MYFNLFFWTRKVINRSYNKLTNMATYTYSKVRTPDPRILDHPNIPETTKDQLKVQYALFDPRKLLTENRRLKID